VAEVKSDSAHIEEACTPFFNFLCKRKVLVPEHFEETSVSQSTLYTEGDSIDTFTVSKVISNRRYVEIYLAIDNATGKEYVIKLLNKNKTSEQKHLDEELMLLEREYSFLANVSHITSICRAYSFNKTLEGHFYMVLEYIKGKALHRYLKEKDSLSKEISFQIINEILQAFALLHKKNLIHGDIHSSNILINDDNSVKIIDMGLTVDVREIEKKRKGKVRRSYFLYASRTYQYYNYK